MNIWEFLVINKPAAQQQGCYQSHWGFLQSKEIRMYPGSPLFFKKIFVFLDVNDSSDFGNARIVRGASVSKLKSYVLLERERERGRELV